MKVLLFIGLALIVLAALHRFDQAPPLPLVKADFPVCVMHHPPPLIPPTRQIVGLPPSSEIA